MILLLDTHIWLWNSLEPDRLSPRVAKELDNLENEIWLSPVSIWELRLLHNKGRLRLIPDAASWINDNLARLLFARRRSHSKWRSRYLR